MDKAKFEELMKKEDFVKKVFESKTSEELKSILQKEGLEVSETDLKQIMDSIAVLTKTSTPVEIKDPTISTPIPLSDEQSTQISGGNSTESINNNSPAFSPEYDPDAPNVNSSSGAVAGAVAGGSVAAAVIGGYALYKKAQEWERKRKEDRRRYRHNHFWY